MLSWDLLERQNCRCSFDVGDIATKVKSLLMLVTLPPKSSHFWCWWHCHQSQVTFDVGDIATKVTFRLGKLRSWGLDSDIAKWHSDQI